MGRHTKLEERVDGHPPMEDPEPAERFSWITKVPLLPLVALTVAGGFVAYGLSTSQISLNFAGSPPRSQAQADADQNVPATTEGSNAAGVIVTYKTTSRTSDGFRGYVWITNRGPKSLEGWRLALKIPDATIVKMSNADVVRTGAVMVVRNQPADSTVTPGSTVRLAFIARGTLGRPSGCKFNDVTCTLRVT